jgi:uncharacterized RDD family membrane protein YckC
MDSGWGLTREEPDEYVLAGRGRRLLAFLINFAVLVLLPLAVALAVDPETFSTTTPSVDAETGALAEQSSDGSLLGIGIMFAWWVVFAIASGILVAKRGQSLGKAAVGIKIVRTDGSRAGFWRIAGLRWFVMALGSGVIAFLGLVDVLMIFRKDRRCLHDLIADTIVVIDGAPERAVRDEVDTATTSGGSNPAADRPPVPFGRPQSPPAW